VFLLIFTIIHSKKSLKKLAQLSVPIFELGSLENSKNVADLFYWVLLFQAIHIYYNKYNCVYTNSVLMPISQNQLFEQFYSVDLCTKYRVLEENWKKLFHAGLIKYSQ